jgi:hypothetical protein
MEKKKTPKNPRTFDHEVVLLCSPGEIRRNAGGDYEYRYLW